LTDHRGDLNLDVLSQLACLGVVWNSRRLRIRRVRRVQMPGTGDRMAAVAEPVFIMPLAVPGEDGLQTVDDR